MKAANVKKVLSIVGNVLLWIFVAFSVFVTILVFSAQNNKEGIPSIMGNSLVTIQSDSMNPTLKKGDLILDKVLTPEEQNSLKKGDIITYLVDLNGDGTPELNTHRITDIYTEGGYTYYVTKGDNNETNPFEDAPIRNYDVVAKYSGTRIPVVGGIISFLQSSIGFLVVIVIPLVLFFLYELYRFIVAMINLKGKEQISAEEKDEIEKRAIEEYRRQQEEKEEDIKKRAIEEYLRQQQEQQEQKDSDQ